jgi:hypothetical protein
MARAIGTIDRFDLFLGGQAVSRGVQTVSPKEKPAAPDLKRV